MGHPKFIENRKFSVVNPCRNQDLLANLSKKYPDRFYFVSCPDVYQGTNKTINHTKCTVVDYGKYFVLGGSGIKDNFNDSGLADPGPYHACSSEIVTDDGLVNKVAAMVRRRVNGYRDQDFVFRSNPEEMENGKKIYRQALALAYKWDRFHKDTPHVLRPESWELSDFPNIRYPALTDQPFRKPPKIHRNECVLYRMLKRPIPKTDLLHMEVPEFWDSSRKALQIPVELFFTGPETPRKNPFAARLVESIEKAKEEIYIVQMYFQPPKRLLEALVDAVKRGVTLTILTGGITKKCPNSEKRFGPKNESHYRCLLNQLNASHKEKVNVYLFEQPNKGLHKKVCLVDDAVFAGSSNLDSKCLMRMEDHEMNFLADSAEVREFTKEVVLVDIAHSKQIFPEPASIRYSRSRR